MSVKVKLARRQDFTSQFLFKEKLNRKKSEVCCEAQWQKENNKMYE
jgi:hypothetical protein